MSVRAYNLQELIARGAPQVFTEAPAAWKQRLVNWFETHPDGPQRKLYPAQVEQVFIDLISYGFALLGAEGQMAVKQRWIAFASGAHLDLLAANNSTYRLKAAHAVTRLRFVAKEAASSSRIIPKGTRVTAGGTAVFVTDTDAVLDAGETTLEVGATALEAGTAGNGWQVGQITEVQAGLPFDVSVSNTLISEGGADEETDDALRFRAANAHDRISKAGPRASYIQQTRAFSPAIIDVAPVRPEPGVIHLYALTDEGAPGVDFMERLYNWLDPDTRRPQGDFLRVLPPPGRYFWGFCNGAGGG